MEIYKQGELEVSADTKYMNLSINAGDQRGNWEVESIRVGTCGGAFSPVSGKLIINCK